MSKHKRKGRLPDFIPIIRTTVKTPAWKAMSMGARSLYHCLRGFLRIDNRNNGQVYRSYRNVVADLGVGSTNTVSTWFR